MASLISLGQIIDKTIAHYKKHFVELFSISAWIAVASVPAAVSKLLDPYVTNTPATPLHIFAIILKDFGGLLIIMVSAWVLLSTILAVSEQAAGGTPNPKTRALRAWKLFFPYAWLFILTLLVIAVILIPPALGVGLILIDGLRGTASILSSLGGILILVGTLFSFVFLVKYSIKFGFSPYSLVLENKRGVQALKHSSSLVAGRWWEVFYRFVVPKVLFSLVLFLLNILLLAALAVLLVLLISDLTLYQGLGNAAWLVLSSLVTAVSLPLFAVTDFYIYDSLRNTRS